MASFRSTLWTIWIAVLLFLVVAAGAMGWGWWKQRAMNQDLASAASKLAEGKPAETELLLAEHLDQDRPSGAWVDQALDLRFQALELLAEQATDAKQKAQYQTTAQTLADRVLDAQRPWVKKGQTSWIRAHMVLAAAALEAEKADAAQPHIQAVLDQPEGSPGREEAILYQCRIQMANNQVPQARQALDGLLEKLAADSPTRRGVERALGLCNIALLRSPEPQEGDQIYYIKKGDTLERIRKQTRVSVEVIQAINAPLDPRRMTINRRLKIPNLEFSIVVNKADNTLTLYNHGKFFKKYSVRTGKSDFMTPTGSFKIVTKNPNPQWTDPKTRQVFAGGQPGNELGCRWLGFQESNIGIHEASDPASIGSYSSNGCVGMLKDDVIELYELVPMGTPVKIVNKRSGTSPIASIPLSDKARSTNAPPVAGATAPLPAVPAVSGTEEPTAEATPKGRANPKPDKTLKPGKTRVRSTNTQ